MADSNGDRRAHGGDDPERRRGDAPRGGKGTGAGREASGRHDGPRNDGPRSGGGYRDRDDRRSSSGDRRDGGPRGDQRGGYRGSDDRRSGGDRPSGDRRSAGGDRRDSGSSRGDYRGGDRRQGGDGRGPDRRGGGPQRRGGEGAFAPRPRDGGAFPERRAARPDEPNLPEEVQAGELDQTVRRDLLSLDKSNANAVARHLVMASKLLEDDPALALAHARAARNRAGRVAVVRETAGIVAYHAGEWAEALSELRAARRMAGGPGLLAVMADCERGLGRPERAIELGRSEEARALSGDEATELRIVVAGARMDLGQFDQAVVTLQTPELDASKSGPTAARLFYAYADALVAAGRVQDGLKWFLNAAAADHDGDTDAEERVAELSGDQ
ncbi:conserved hypothetical protein [Rhodococcus sp. RD6.2]|uniref:tetratricopeptide repeat protein n=1 Tax=Rhodococcus sp. RD6.2 TaxID=260936 RepID=UPI00063B8AD4|nr:hypothetical protein [Rhodococcus sp. RD6.2]CRK51336.1 conserved hypothetical protein [Rhodococcus sp. RD6.2]